MDKITVYQFEMFDIIKGETITSEKYATEETIKEIKAAAIKKSKIEIDSSKLDGNGMYKP